MLLYSNLFLTKSFCSTQIGILLSVGLQRWTYFAIRMNEKYEKFELCICGYAVSTPNGSLVLVFVCANAFSSASSKIFDLAVASEIFHISELHRPHFVLRIRTLCS